MTAVATYHAPPKPAQPPVNLTELLAFSAALVPTGFLPEHIKTPGQCAAIILTGRELGMEPMRAIRSLQMVKGKVIENADSQLARFKSDGGRAVWKVLTETEAVLYLRHPNSDEHTERFTIEDAKRAQLAGGQNWQKFPKAMLRSRCITAALKSIGWEGGTGTYDPEEFGMPALEESAGTASESGRNHAGSTSGSTQEMTLEEALAEPLRGPASSWGGYGGTPLGEVSPRVIEAARAFFADKLASKPEDERLARQVRALTIVRAHHVAEGVAEPADAVPARSNERDTPEEDAAPAPVTVSAKKAARPLPADLAEIKRWNLADLQATALAVLEDPAFANSRAGHIAEINAGLNHARAVVLVRELAEALADTPKAKAARSGRVGDLPGDPA